jgi:hypothetical protein
MAQVATGHIFVDQATDPGKIVESLTEPFSQVFPITEDLIIHLIDDIPNPVLGSVIRSYKNGNYSAVPPTPATPGLIPASPPVYSYKTIKISVAKKVVELAPISSYNAISVQNSLRQLLSTYFPSGEDKYSQYCYPVSSEAERLWKPVFRNDENASIGNEDRTVDQIIAFGCEAGVKMEFLHQISGQIERLGMKRDGVNRSGKLDIRCGRMYSDDCIKKMLTSWIQIFDRECHANIFDTSTYRSKHLQSAVGSKDSRYSPCSRNRSVPCQQSQYSILNSSVPIN